MLYDPEFISRLSESISTILAAFVTSPDSLLGDIMDNLHDQKTIATVKDKNLFTPFPSEKCLFQLFETQASQTPEMQASSDASASFNYSTLRQKMNETARYLFEKGVKRGSRVAVYMERNALLPAFLMGIQKAGAA